MSRKAETRSAAIGLAAEQRNGSSKAMVAESAPQRNGSASHSHEAAAFEAGRIAGRLEALKELGEEITTRRVEVIDAKGRTRIELASGDNGAGGNLSAITLYGPDPKDPRDVITLASLHAEDKQGGSEVFMEMRGTDSELRLGVDVDDRPTVSFTHEGRTWRLELGDGAPRLVKGVA